MLEWTIGDGIEEDDGTRWVIGRMTFRVAESPEAPSAKEPRLAEVLYYDIAGRHRATYKMDTVAAKWHKASWRKDDKEG